jgi:hypothetical protein
MESPSISLSSEEISNAQLAIQPDALLAEINKLESTYAQDEFDHGYRSAVVDIMGIISRLSASQK